MTERIALLLHLLRLPSVSIDHLECATSTIALQIPREKQAILHAIYECAKAERKAITTSYSEFFSLPLFMPDYTDSFCDCSWILRQIVCHAFAATYGCTYSGGGGGRVANRSFARFLSRSLPSPSCRTSYRPRHQSSISKLGRLT